MTIFRTEPEQPPAQALPPPPAPRPEPVEPPAPPAPPSPPPYQGPSAGTLIWTGNIDGNTLLKIQGGGVNFGRLTNELPGIAVRVEVEPRDFVVVDAPSAANNWKSVSLRSLRRVRQTVIRWVRQ